MYCKECGKKISSDSRYCMYCGEFLNYSQQRDDSSPSDNKATSLKNKKINKPKYDSEYQKRYDAAIVGAVIFFINFFLIVTGTYHEYGEDGLAVMSILNLIWRIGVIVWVLSIANEQNRNTFGWAVYAFFIPNIALINIGLLRRIIINDRIGNSGYETGGNIGSTGWQCPNCYEINYQSTSCSNCRYKINPQTSIKPRAL